MPEINGVFVNIDFSGSKQVIDQALESDDMETAKQHSQKVLDVQEEIKQNTKSVGGKLVFDSGINLIVYVPYDEELIDSFSSTYEEKFGEPTNVGVGRTPIEAHSSLDTVQAGHVNQIILYSSGIREDLEEVRRFYKQADKTKYDLKIANVIKSALFELNIITTEQKVYDIFLRLVKENGLDTIEALQLFFYRPLEELKSAIRNIYDTQKTAGLRFAVQPQTAPGQTTIPKGKHQRSPHRRHNWLTIEEYNDGVDYRKTDVTWVGGNITNDSQNMSMGGEPGEAVSTV